MGAQMLSQECTKISTRGIKSLFQLIAQKPLCHKRRHIKRNRCCLRQRKKAVTDLIRWCRPKTPRLLILHLRNSKRWKVSIICHAEMGLAYWWLKALNSIKDFTCQILTIKRIHLSIMILMKWCIPLWSGLMVLEDLPIKKMVQGLVSGHLHLETSHLCLFQDQLSEVLQVLTVIHKSNHVQWPSFIILIEEYQHSLCIKERIPIQNLLVSFNRLVITMIRISRE
jgi:hypothetical protein